MAEEIARGVGPDRIDIAYERLGDLAAPPVVLMMGGGAQMINWPDEFCAMLVDSGMQVVRFDNRDVGRSTHLTDAPAPDLPAALAGDCSSASYTLSDMAADTVGLLGALGIDAAHLVGASLGGMVAQTVALEYRLRVRSLTSMMSTTGDRAVGQPDPAVIGALGTPPTDRSGFVAWQVRAMRAVASPGFPFEEEAVAERAGRAYDRGHDPVGILRQSVAVLASGDRTVPLRGLRTPSLVIHGAADVMCDVSGGRATADAIPRSELAVFDGMGHSLPRALWPAFTERITALVRRAEPIATAMA
ncbi:Alpha/beta hydrolase [Frankia canadensis]|uniref:Alpha/beta hydrolase n=1 Tax=Frankia canadensis TaxID=1836972 RepID=A0A2I2KVZ1_9ACTN|nr:alpha/beta hydrolase [Frankia canadensis]SNQ49830.1 Alpha/beta hydrolase [Frankia canadensis]SOU57120.1 Alpha/beta hydrolase [Frankia canadensis]